MMIVRPMKRADLDAVYLIETLSFRSPWSKQSLAGELRNTVAH